LYMLAEMEEWDVLLTDHKGKKSEQVEHMARGRPGLVEQIVERESVTQSQEEGKVGARGSFDTHTPGESTPGESVVLHTPDEEVDGSHKRDATEDRRKVHVRERRPQYMPPRRELSSKLFIVALALFGTVWALLRFVGRWQSIDATVFAAALTAGGLYIVVLATTGLCVYHSCSFYDGVNVVTAFTTRLGPPSAPRSSFVHSNYPATISDTISSRGTSLNKLGIAYAFVIGFLLFVKFSSLPDPRLLLAAFGYLLISFTGLYENRSFNVGIDDHDARFQPGSKLTQVGTIFSGSANEDKLYPKLSCFRFIHFFGVVPFVVCPSVTFLWVGPFSGVWSVSAILSVLSLSFAACFVLFFTPLQAGCTGKRTPGQNKCLAFVSLALEGGCLICIMLAGVLFQQTDVLR